MLFTQYYLDCLSQASYLIGDESTGQAVVVDPRRDVGEYLDDAAAKGLDHRRRDQHPLPRRLRLRAPRARPGDRRVDRLRRRRVRRLPHPPPRGPRADQPRRGDPRGHDHARAHPGVDQHPGLRAPRRRDGLRRAHRRRPLHRRRRPPRPARLGRGHRGRAGPDALRLGAAQADGPARRGARLPRPRRRIGVWQEPVHRAAVDDRQPAGVQLRLPAHVGGAVPRRGHRGSARRPRLLPVQRDPEQAGARPARHRRDGAGADRRPGRGGPRLRRRAPRRARRAGVRRRPPARVGQRARRRPHGRDGRDGVHPRPARRPHRARGHRAGGRDPVRAHRLRQRGRVPSRPGGLLPHAPGRRRAGQPAQLPPPRTTRWHGPTCRSSTSATPARSSPG